jgi:hypothetical protein
MAKHLQKDFEQYVSQLSNEDLVTYIHAPEGTYWAEATAFARQVLKSRGLSAAELTRLEELANAQATREQTEEFERERLSIPWYWKPWIVLCGLFLLLLVPAYVLIGSSTRFFVSGEKRKVRQLWTYAMIGLGLLILFACFVRPTREGIYGWIILPIVPSIFLGGRLRHFLDIPRDDLPRLSEMEFVQMKHASGSGFGMLGLSTLFVPITSVLLYKFTTQSDFLILLVSWSITIVGLGTAGLLDLRAEGLKKRGKQAGP